MVFLWEQNLVEPGGSNAGALNCAKACTPTRCLADLERAYSRAYLPEQFAIRSGVKKLHTHAEKRRSQHPVL